MAFWSNVCSGRSCCCRRRRSLLAQCGRPRSAQDNRPPPGGLVNDQPTSSSLSYTTCLFEGKKSGPPPHCSPFSLVDQPAPPSSSFFNENLSTATCGQSKCAANVFLPSGPLEIYVLLMARCFTLLFNSSRSNRGHVSSISNGGAHRFACGVWPRPDSDLLPFECFG